MSKLIVIGEALIDFVPDEKGLELKSVGGFKRVAGGAVANVAGACARFDQKSVLLTKVANDAFGEYLVDCFIENNIDISNVVYTSDYDTSLAFVSLKEDGNRDFKFYRRTAADLQFSEDDVKDDICQPNDIVHFCSVDLVDSPMKKAHVKLIRQAIDHSSFVCFDPNLRFSLWDDLDKLKSTVNEFMTFADIIKISDEELSFITGYEKVEEALDHIFKDRCKLFIYTKGKDGASLYTKDGRVFEVAGNKVDVVDTTGAGDSFIGAFIACLLNDNVTDLNNIADDKLSHYLDVANKYAACTTCRQGALGAMATMDEFEEFCKEL